MPTVSQIVTWLVVGALAGTLVGRLVTRSKQGYGPITNTLMGVAGAVVGGFLFRIFQIDLGLGEFKVTVEDLIAALYGSIVVLVVVWGIRTKKKRLFWIIAAAAMILLVVVFWLLSR